MRRADSHPLRDGSKMPMGSGVLKLGPLAKASAGGREDKVRGEVAGGKGRAETNRQEILV
jgi:hypothetical protein